MYTDPFGLCEKISGTKAPCDLIMAAYSEARGGTHARAEAQGIAHAIINRAKDNKHNYGYKNTGNLDADISGQIGAAGQVQGKGNSEWNQLSTLLSGEVTAFDLPSGQKLSDVVGGVEAAYGASEDPTKGATYWDHRPSKPGQGASQSACAPTPTTTMGTASFAKCSK